VLDESHLRVTFAQLAYFLRRTVPAAIVHDDNFIIVSDRPYDLNDFHHRRAYVFLLVVSW